MNERYSLEKAREEADKMETAIRSGEAKNYIEAASVAYWRTENFDSPLDEGSLRLRFEHIIDRLGLTVDDLRDKKVLDIGAGDRSIAAYCQLKGVTSEVYSAEPHIYHERYASSRALENWPAVKAQIDKKTVKDKRGELSFKDGIFDLVVNHAAFPAPPRNGNIEGMESAVNKALNEMARVLKSDGEARVFPVELKAIKESEIEIIKPYADAITRKLDQLVEDGICNVEIEEVETQYSKREGKIKQNRIIMRRN